MKINRFIPALLFTCSTIWLCAQPVEVSGFQAIQNNKQVLLHWTIEKGSTCNGISIWRSTDSIIYTEIGNIDGVCGNSSSAIAYDFTDKNPVLNQTNYYKLRLGHSQFSEVKAAFITFIEHGVIRVKPNPSTTGKIIIEFNNDRRDNYSMIINDEAGRRIYALNNITDGKIELSTNNWGAGTYIVVLLGPGEKLLKKKLLVIK